MNESISKRRTLNYFREIKGSIIYKAVAMVASFLAIPLMIRYLGQERFGVWATLLSVMSWVVLFDLGIGNGLRNKLAESLAKGDKREAADFVASAYSMIGLIALFLWMVITGVSFFVPWQRVFNTQSVTEASLRSTVQIAGFFIVFNFWIGLISPVLGAVQKVSLNSLSQVISNVVALILVIVLMKVTSPSIIYLAIVYGISMIVANLSMSLWFYLRFPELAPSARFLKEHTRPLLFIGSQFFIIQIAVLILFTTDKILITQIFGARYVTQYEVVFRLFSVIIFVHSLISMPLWSAYTDAYQRRNFDWIEHMLYKQLKIFCGLVVAVIILGFATKTIIAYWIGPGLSVSVALIISMGIFVIISTWNNVYAMLVNGIGKIRAQLYTAIIAMLLNIPLTLILTKYFRFGLSGVVIANGVCLLFASVVLPIQVHGILRNHREGRV